MMLPPRPIAALVALSLLAGCSGFAQSRLNPVNWFGPRAQTVAAVTIEKPADPRALIDEIVDVVIEPLPSGAMVRATGRAATQGYWAADLVVLGLNDKGALVIDFRAAPAPEGTAVSTPRSREITAAVALRADTYASAQRIIVKGARGEKTARNPRAAR